MYTVLVCDDDTAILNSIQIYLKMDGYNVLLAENGLKALELLEKNEVHCIILDIMMPGLDGLNTTLKIRQTHNIPIILLSAKSEDTDKITGLGFGADDYVTKPFSPSEFTARVDALARRVSSSLKRNSEEDDENVITSGEFKLDCKSRTLTCNGRKIDVTQVEFQILEYFFRNQGTNLSRTDILNHVWGTEYFGEEKIVDVNIRRIRKKIEPDPSNPKHLLTRWGFGYAWI